MQDHLTDRQRESILQRANQLMASGRLREGEVRRLRGASDPAQLDAVVRDISSRHAAERLEAAAARQELTADEAAHLRERLKQGEHPSFLRRHLGRSKTR